MQDEIAQQVKSDCVELLSRILDSDLSKTTFKVNLACSPKLNSRVIGNKFRKDPVFLYKYKESFTLLDSAGLFKKLPLETIEPYELETVVYEALTTGQKQLDGDYYRTGRLDDERRVEVNRQTIETWLAKHGKYTPNNEKYFGFADKTFWLKRVSGEDDVIINFHPTKKSDNTNPLILMQSFIYFLRTHGVRRGEFFEVKISASKLLKHLNESSPTFNINSNWLRNTKANLIKKVPINGRDSIIFGKYNIVDGYSFSLRLPY